MANNKHIQKKFKEWVDTLDPGRHYVFVSPDWLRWYAEEYDPEIDPDQEVSFDFGSGIDVMVIPRQGIGQFPKGDYVMVRAPLSRPEWWLHRVGERESDEGFLPEDEYSAMEMDHMEVANWLSEPQRMALVEDFTRTNEILHWRFTDENSMFEFRMRWDFM